MNDDFVPAHPQDPGLDPAADAAGHAEAILKVEDVSKIYRSGDTEVHAVSSATMAVDQGEFVALLGPSGSGKTTLISMIGGLLSPTTGSITLAGTDVASLSKRELTAFRAERVGFVFQAANLVPFLTARENLRLQELAFREEIRAWVRANLPADISQKVHGALRLSQLDHSIY